LPRGIFWPETLPSLYLPARQDGCRRSQSQPMLVVKPTSKATKRIIVEPISAVNPAIQMVCSPACTHVIFSHSQVPCIG
jgi:hypothetical protein